MLFEGDFDPTLRADFPAAVRAALNGDPAPMLRLVASTTGAETFDPSGGDSQALFLATSCEDASLPWAQSATPSQRLSESRQSFNQIAPSSYAPFDPDTVFNFSLAPFCANWPESGDSPPVESAPPPAVPTLILSGDDDLRTPQEDAARVAALLPKATLVRVPNVGHSVLGDDLSSCSLRAVQHFFRGEPQGICQSRGALFPPSPVPPRSISQLPAFRHQPQKVGRTLTATEFTLDDLFERLLDGFLESPDGFSVAPMGGLRAGFFTTGSKAITLHGYSLGARRGAQRQVPHARAGAPDDRRRGGGARDGDDRPPRRAARAPRRPQGVGAAGRAERGGGPRGRRPPRLAAVHAVPQQRAAARLSVRLPAAWRSSATRW